MTDNKLFRQKTLEKISSPEQLNDYIRVTTPGVWMVLLSVILMLGGLVVWGNFGRLETRLHAPVIVQEGQAVLYIQADDILKIRSYQELEIGDYSGEITGIGYKDLVAEEVLGDLALSEAGYDEKEVVYEAYGEIEAPNGIYMGDIVLESVKPVSFLTNQ